MEEEKRTTQRLIYAICIVFAIFLIMDSIAYLANPYSGRISVLECKRDGYDKSICTVTIYGIRETYQREFKAAEFYEAVTIVKELGVSEKRTCGVTIITSKERINFVHQHEHCPVADRIADKINYIFDSGEYKPYIRNIQIRLNSSFYRRGMLLIAALGLAILFRRSEYIDLLSDILSEEGDKFRQLTMYWFKGNFLVRVFFYLAIAFILAIWIIAIWKSWYPIAQSDFVRSCSYVVWNCYECNQLPFNYLLCLYPLWAILVIQALVQRYLLNKYKLTVSKWWVAAPIIASIPLVLMFPWINCNDCFLLKYLMLGLMPRYDPSIIIGLFYYFLFLGILQWLMLRKKLSSSFLWVIMPVINGMLATLINWILVEYCFNYITPVIRIPTCISLALYIIFYLTIFTILVVVDFLSAFYVSWLINIKNRERIFS
jgi:hypothetical protein